MKINVDAD